MCDELYVKHPLWPRQTSPHSVIPSSSPKRKDRRSSSMPNQTPYPPVCHWYASLEDPAAKTNSGERPIGAANSKPTNTMAPCPPPPSLTQVCAMLLRETNSDIVDAWPFIRHHPFPPVPCASKTVAGLQLGAGSSPSSRTRRTRTTFWGTRRAAAQLPGA